MGKLRESEKKIFKFIFSSKKVSFQDKNDFRKYLENFKKFSDARVVSFKLFLTKILMNFLQNFENFLCISIGNNSLHQNQLCLQNVLLERPNFSLFPAYFHSFSLKLGRPHMTRSVYRHSNRNLLFLL